jgi:hypothetical protein
MGMTMMRFKKPRPSLRPRDVRPESFCKAAGTDHARSGCATRRRFVTIILSRLPVNLGNFVLGELRAAANVAEADRQRRRNVGRRRNLCDFLHL